jgi:1-deoxy-D-xylulose-5-phosphate synthase
VLINQINSPKDLKTLSVDELLQLSDEIRHNIIDSISQTGGHLGASLGVIELSIALHYVFSTPNDKIIWDVGHQSHPHKLLTGRKKLHTLKQDNGLSGFTKRSESIFDPFGAGHSSTSISAALGIDIANQLQNKKHITIAVIGDGALTAGMAYEALNNAGNISNKLVIILNDNEMSISPTEGALKNYLNKLSKKEKKIKKFASNIENTIQSLPLGSKVQHIIEKIKKSAIHSLDTQNLFENLGITYKGPINGHNIKELITNLEEIQLSCTKKIATPILLHIKTEKGRGFFSPNGNASEKFHAVSKFCKDTFVQDTQSSLTYTHAFASRLTKNAKHDSKIVAITAAMPSGTGLELFKNEFPNRFFDVGIAEQHAATFAAGLATEGIKPFFAVYSTFLQRAYDQIIHDIAIQNLAVRFAIDRAGLVGGDGPTHAGSFDIAFMSILPHMTVMAPGHLEDLYQMVDLACEYDDGPIAFRYPRGNAAKLSIKTQKLLLGKGNIIEEGNNLAIISFGSKLPEAIAAAKILKDRYKISTTIVDARFAKPLDTKLIKDVTKNHQLIITLEEGSIGGFATQVNHFLLNNNLLNNTAIRNLLLPDIFIEHGSLEKMYKKAQLDVDSIISCTTDFFKVSNIETLEKHFA